MNRCVKRAQPEIPRDITPKLFMSTMTRRKTKVSAQVSFCYYSWPFEPLKIEDSLKHNGESSNVEFKECNLLQESLAYVLSLSQNLCQHLFRCRANITSLYLLAPNCLMDSPSPY